MVVDFDRVLRGGSWNNNGGNVRSAIRNRNRPDNRNDNIGFRLALARRIAEAPSTRPSSCLPLGQRKPNAVRYVSSDSRENLTERRL